MGCDICVLAPAKVNFGLKVRPKGPDGYHNIESVFQTITLCDVITVREVNGKGHCEVRCKGKPMQADNTVSRAYDAFAEVTGKKGCSVSVDIEKRIPMGGGLGGGSTDAAAFVAALEVLTATALTVPERKIIASLVGCDVYFFLLCGEGGCAVVTGRGDIVKPIRAREDLKMLLVFPPFASATKEAYMLLDAQREGEGKGASGGMESAVLEEVYGRPVRSWTFVNDFTPSLSGRFPTVRSILGDLREAGSAYCEMSGSGSTLYGVFDTCESVERARLMLAERHGDCRLLAVSPFGGSHKMLDCRDVSKVV